MKMSHITHLHLTPLPMTIIYGLYSHPDLFFLYICIKGPGHEQQNIYKHMHLHPYKSINSIHLLFYTVSLKSIPKGLSSYLTIYFLYVHEHCTKLFIFSLKYSCIIVQIVKLWSLQWSLFLILHVLHWPSPPPFSSVSQSNPLTFFWDTAIINFMSARPEWCPF